MVTGKACIGWIACHKTSRTVSLSDIEIPNSEIHTIVFAWASPRDGSVDLMKTTIVYNSDMKVRNSVRSLKNKPGAQVVRRRGRIFVINKKDPRYKGRQG